MRNGKLVPVLRPVNEVSPLSVLTSYRLVTSTSETANEAVQQAVRSSQATAACPDLFPVNPTRGAKDDQEKHVEVCKEANQGNNDSQNEYEHGSTRRSGNSGDSITTDSYPPSSKFSTPHGGQPSSPTGLLPTKKVSRVCPPALLLILEQTPRSPR
jgi:hypothetical protein